MYSHWPTVLGISTIICAVWAITVSKVIAYDQRATERCIDARYAARHKAAK